MLQAPRSKIVLLMGVAGTGKTTVGRQLAAELGWPYHEADDFHSAANKEKMGRGVPLDDTDRAPWLAAIRAAMDECRAAGRSAVFSCSALKDQYRRVLLDGAPATALVFLSGDREMLLARLAERSAHYMKPTMLESQFAILEPPADALRLDVRQSPGQLVAAIRRHCGV